jgi:putative flavoprotein involved in K+ transport
MIKECAVVGAGAAGLATSRALVERGLDHVVLERDEVGHSWQTQRWDSFRLNTPGWMNGVLGRPERIGYATAPEVVAALDGLAAPCLCNNTPRCSCSNGM